MMYRLVLGAALALSVAAPAFAGNNNVRITGLTDLALTVSFTSDTTSEEDVCVYSSSPTSGYRVTGTGSGSGGAFTLTTTPAGPTLAYEVQWNAQAGQTTGTQLTPGTPLTGLTSAATQQQCNSGPPSSASLIVVLRASAVSAASAGSYGGSLTLLIAPE